jgi:phosphoribosylformylglycinamidine (FGAM) synthase-like amidotransferase family enzyme
MIVFLAVVLLVGCGAEAVEFRLQPREGDELEYEMNMEMTMKQKMMGSTMTTHQKQVIGFDQRVLAVEDDGTIRQEMEYTRMAMDMSMEGADGNEVFSSHYDSDQPEESDQQFQNLGKLVGVTTEMKVSPNGEIIEVSGWDEAMDRVLADLPTEMKAQFKDVFGEKAMMGWMSEINASYQSDPVSVGDTFILEAQESTPVQ